jgi:protein CpxP
MKSIQIRKYAVAGILAGVLALAGGLAAGDAAAREWGPWAGHGGGDSRVLGMIKKIGLSADQKAQLAALLKAQRDNLAAKHESAAAARRTLMTLMTADAVDEQALGAALDTAASTHKEMALAWIKVRQDVQALLTPEQLAQVKEMRDRLVHRMEDRHAGMTARGTERLDRLIEDLAR